MDSIVVTLGGKEYEISPLPYKASKKWREKLGAPVQQLMGVLAEADVLKLDNPADLVEILNVAKTALLDSPDLIFEAVCSYCPAIERDRERIEETAFDPEIMDAFIEVLRLAFPFSRLLSMMRRSPSG